VLALENVDRTVRFYWPSTAFGGLFRAWITAAKTYAKQVPGAKYAALGGQCSSDGKYSHR